MSSETQSRFTYLPIAGENIQWALYLTGRGTARIAPHSPYPPPGHPELYQFDWKVGRVLPEYQVVFIAEGAGLFESAQTGRVPLTAGQAVLLFPGEWHRYRPAPRTGWTEHWLSMNGEYLHQLQRRGVISQARAVRRVARPGAMIAAHERVAHEIDRHPLRNPHTLSAGALEVLALALESPDDHPAAPHEADTARTVEDPVLAEAVQLIWTHSYRGGRAMDLVQRLPVTRRTLERRFRRVLGRSIAQEITRCRVARAKQMLAETRLPIRHIALAVGFPNADRMGKVFNRIEKLTPGKFRAVSKRA